MPWLRRPGVYLLLMFLLAPVAAGEPRRLTGDELARHLKNVKRLEVELLRLTARRSFARARAARSNRGRVAGSAARPAPASDLPPPRARAAAPVASASAVVALPSNVKLNNSAGDNPNATQSEESVAALGSHLVAAWNDGQGSFTGGAYQGFAWSADGGQTWVDGGDPPKPVAFPQFRWTSDPVMAVNEKTGVFYYCALANSDLSHNAIAVARGAFSGDVFAWQDVQVVREAANTNSMLDKPWIAADSSGAGTFVYLAYSTFTHSGNQIDFQRSTNGGATWSNASKLSSNADNGQVHGSRPAVGPGGELYMVWNAIGQGVAEDFLRLRKSTDHGQSFGNEVTITGYLANFGTGAPGFNRERGIHFPSLAADRSFGTHRGRVYTAWTESYNFQDDALGTGLSRLEAEPNGLVAIGSPFNPGDVLRGTIATASPADLDYWSFTLAAGQSLVAWADSLAAGMTYAMRVFGGGADTAQSLCFGGDFTPGSSVQQAFYSFTAPLSATYTLRMGPIDGSSPIGGYRVRTALGVRDGERGRDQRDVFVSWSDDGTTWSVPARVNDDPVGFDDYLAEVGVGSDGCPYALWFDFRDEPFGATAHQYVSRSLDGGANWATNQRITDVATNWPNTGSSLAPNMGDYSALVSSEAWLHAAWADGRDGSADVYGARLGMGASIAACAPNVAVSPGATAALSWTLANANGSFANSYTGSIATARNWPLPSPANVVVNAGGVAPLDLSLVVPDTAAAGAVAVTFTAMNSTGAILVGCSTTLTVGGPVGIGAGPTVLSLAPPLPNPASDRVDLAFSLPSAGSASLQIYAVSGRRMRTVLEGRYDAGPHHVRWDGRDDHGLLVAPGVYFVRLETAAGSRMRRLVWVR